MKLMDWPYYNQIKLKFDIKLIIIKKIIIIAIDDHKKKTNIIIPGVRSKMGSNGSFVKKECLFLLFLLI